MQLARLVANASRNFVLAIASASLLAGCLEDKKQVEPPQIQGVPRTDAVVGVPYTDEMVANAAADLKAQADPDADTKGLETRYPKAKTANFDGNKQMLSEMDALVAYLQMLGTLVDFSTYNEAAGYR